MTAYDAAIAQWRQDPEAYWLAAAQGLDWTRSPSRALDANQGMSGRWFADGVLNTCHHALDRHVAAGRGEQVAIVYDSPSPA